MTRPDTVTTQWLNLLHGSPSFVVRIDPRTGAPTVIQVEVVPEDGGVCWKIGGTWVASSEKTRILGAMEAEEADVFPFDWTCAVPLVRDIYHDE